MIGKKLHLLIKEISISQVKIIVYRCSLSTDKRFEILKDLISIRHKDEVEINSFIQNAVNIHWTFTSVQENQLKIRRLNHFLCEQLELVIIESFLTSSPINKNLLLAQALEKNGNPILVKNYFQNVQQHAKLTNDLPLQLLSIEGQLKLNFYTQNDYDLEKSLQLNETLIQTLSYTNNKKTADYYETISTIYLEKTKIVIEKKNTIILAIFQLLNSETSPLNRCSLFVSLAKLHYDEGNFYYYFEKAKMLLNEFTNTSEANELKEKIQFLELRIRFFEGETIENLRPIIQQGNHSIQVGKSILFYKILFLILDHELDSAQVEIENSTALYKNEYLIYNHFLKALYFIKNNEPKKAIQLLNSLMYSNNYFFALFSRLLMIQLQINLKNEYLCKSFLTSTKKYMQQNKENPLGKEANENLIKCLQNTFSNRKLGEISKIKGSILHQFIYQNIN
ncbi:MAG: hypothetical protein HYR91_14440 [Flavobacteriia bacterium]|nr:hypothetical protein [Flavobacteriia bacterium]